MFPYSKIPRTFFMLLVTLILLTTACRTIVYVQAPDPAASDEELAYYEPSDYEYDDDEYQDYDDNYEDEFSEYDEDDAPQSTLTNAQCQQSSECADYGHCAVSRTGTNCRPQIEAHCQQSTACKTHGYCAIIVESLNLCAATTNAHCYQSDLCYQQGRCYMEENNCVAKDEADCLDSEGCKRDGNCKLTNHQTCETRTTFLAP